MKAFGLFCLLPLVAFGGSGFVITPGERWIPFEMKRDVEKGSAMDFSSLAADHAPAGKFGFVRAVGDHFEFEGRPGVAQRFNGANLCMEANYPQTEEDADRLVARLVRSGYNSVRIHHHDSRFYRLDKDLRPVVDEKWAKLFDRFVAKAVAAGLYLTTDLYVSRKVSRREIGIEEKGSDRANFKTMLFLHDGAMENWKAAAKAFLTHCNPYTGRTYAEEPALACLCLVNENSIQHCIRELRTDEFLVAKWGAWFKAKRAAEPGCWPTLKPEEIPAKSGGWSIEPVLEGEGYDAFSQFFAELERNMYVKMRDYLRNELKVKVPLTDENFGTQTAPLQAVRTELYDYADSHIYIDHPDFPGGGWSPPSTLWNENLFAKEGTKFDVAYRRAFNRPFAVSEWNFCGPGRHRSQGGLYMGTLAALQNWSALWRFAYSHGNSAFNDEPGYVAYFDVGSDPAGLVSERLVSSLFLRGDLKMLEKSVALELTSAAVTPSGKDKAYNVLPKWWRNVFDARVGTVMPGGAPAGAVVSPLDRAATEDAVPGKPGGSSQVVFDVKRGTMSVNTPRTAALYALGGEYAAGPLSVVNRGGEATVWATSLDGRDLAVSSRILFVRLGDIQSPGTEFADESCRRMNVRGENGVVMEAGTSDVRLKLSGERTVWALDMSGRRLVRIPSEYANGELRFAADVARDPKNASFVYEITCPERENVVFVGAHQDDIISSLGTMILMKDKFKLHVVDYTDGGYGNNRKASEIRRKEEQAVCAALGAEMHEIGEHDGDTYASRESAFEIQEHSVCTH